MLPLRVDQPRQRAPVVTVGLILACLGTFLYQLSLGPELPAFFRSAAFVPARLFDDGLDLQAGPALLSMFLHGGFAHLGGNMLFLWIFGDNVEDRLGHLRFLLFYLLCGLAATYAHAAFNPGSTVPVVGASGAIAGVLGAYLLLFPGARVLTLVFLGFFITTVKVPVLVYLPIWFLLQFLSGLAALQVENGEAGGVAWFAHIGGFLAGPLFLLLFLPRKRRRRPRQPW
jgi:membrane associated rhomboid family serine protease